MRARRLGPCLGLALAGLSVMAHGEVPEQAQLNPARAQPQSPPSPPAVNQRQPDAVLPYTPPVSTPRRPNAESTDKSQVKPRRGETEPTDVEKPTWPSVPTLASDADKSRPSPDFVDATPPPRLRRPANPASEIVPLPPLPERPPPFWWPDRKRRAPGLDLTPDWWSQRRPLTSLNDAACVMGPVQRSDLPLEVGTILLFPSAENQNAVRETLDQSRTVFSGLDPGLAACSPVPIVLPTGLAAPVTFTLLPLRTPIAYAANFHGRSRDVLIIGSLRAFLDPNAVLQSRESQPSTVSSHTERPQLQAVSSTEYGTDIDFRWFDLPYTLSLICVAAEDSDCGRAAALALFDRLALAAGGRQW